MSMRNISRPAAATARAREWKFECAPYFDDIHHSEFARSSHVGCNCCDSLNRGSQHFCQKQLEA